MDAKTNRMRSGKPADTATNPVCRPGIQVYAMLMSVVALTVCLMPIHSAHAGEDEAHAQNARVTQNAFFTNGGRDQQTPDRVETLEQRDAAEPGKSGRATRGSAQKSTGRQQQTPNTDFWFYTADTELFADNDLDGYFYGIDLLFDADTIYDFAAVYAVVYLSRNGGPWLEYAVTEVFEIYGATSEDEFVIVTELLAGYPTGSYDILVELFDTYDNAFVASIGPENTPELSFLPLEDAELDVPYIPPPIVVEQGGGGATGAATLGLALLVLLSRRAARSRRLPRWR